MREFGEVIAVKGKMITVRFPRKTACGHCGMCAVKPNDAHVDMRMEDTIGCKTGDRVEVNISNGTVLKMSLLVYTMPLVVALIGFFIAYFCGAAEVWQLVAFVASLTVGFLALSLIDKRYANKNIEEISVMVGFSNRQSFYAAFYKNVGETPNGYRKRKLTNK